MIASSRRDKKQRNTPPSHRLLFSAITVSGLAQSGCGLAYFHFPLSLINVSEQLQLTPNQFNSPYRDTKKPGHNVRPNGRTTAGLITNAPPASPQLLRQISSAALRLHLTPNRRTTSANHHHGRRQTHSHSYNNPLRRRPPLPLRARQRIQATTKRPDSILSLTSLPPFKTGLSQSISAAEIRQEMGWSAIRIAEAG